MLDYRNLFSPNEYKNNDKNNNKIFSTNKKLIFWMNFLKCLEWEKSIVLSGKSIKNFKSLKYYILVIKHCFFLVFVARVEAKMKKYLKKKNQLK